MSTTHFLLMLIIALLLHRIIIAGAIMVIAMALFVITAPFVYIDKRRRAKRAKKP